jgi:hypothetical protein
MPCPVFSVLADAAGATLAEFTGFRIHSPTGEAIPVFCRFAALRVLRWECDIKFPDLPGDSLRTALPELEFLDSTNSSNGFYPLLVKMKCAMHSMICVS